MSTNYIKILKIDIKLFCLIVTLFSFSVYCGMITGLGMVEWQTENWQIRGKKLVTQLHIKMKQNSIKHSIISRKTTNSDYLYIWTKIEHMMACFWH